MGFAVVLYYIHITQWYKRFHSAIITKIFWYRLIICFIAIKQIDHLFGSDETEAERGTKHINMKQRILDYLFYSNKTRGLFVLYLFVLFPFIRSSIDSGFT